MAYLVLASGDEALAQKVRAAENTAYVADMRTPGLAQWLGNNGMRPAEAAFVQPAYCACPDEEMPVCGVDGRTYLNECVAVECREIEVAHDGECERETGNADEWPMAHDTGGAPPDDEEAAEKKSACSINGRPGAFFWVVLLPAVLRRRRRQ